MSKWPSVCMKFFRKNGEPAMKTNSGRCLLGEAERALKQSCEQASVISQTTPASANTSHTGTFAVNSATAAPISARLVKPK